MIENLIDGFLVLLSPFVAKLSNMPQSLQQNPMIPTMQECVDAITDHQRLHALMKGEWVKGLLPQSSVREDYTVQRVRGNYDLILYYSLSFSVYF